MCIRHTLGSHEVGCGFIIKPLAAIFTSKGCIMQPLGKGRVGVNAETLDRGSLSET
jgi:hypothetical protein